MRFLVALSLAAALLQSQNPPPGARKVGQPQQQYAQTSQQRTSEDKRGTEQSPLVVKIAPPTKTATEADQETKDRNEKAANDRHLVDLTGVLAFVGFLQLMVFGYQAYKLRETVQSAGKQSEAMERHIGEAARSANAMEEIVKVIDEGNQAVMRAYITVVIGTAIYQQKREGQGDFKFEARPLLVNAGNTPARGIKIRITAEILPVPPPDGFEFADPNEDFAKDAGVLGAHQNANMSGIVKDFVPWNEVADIKEGNGKALYTWGFITYEDIFGTSHRTKFGQWVTWLPNGQVFGYYMGLGQNYAD